MKTWTGLPRVFAHAKRDGHSVLMRKASTGLVRFLAPKTELTAHCRRYPWYENCLKHVPGSTDVTGELWAPGFEAADIKTLLLAGDPRLRWEPFEVNSFPASMSLSRVEDAVVSWGLDFIQPWHTSWDFDELEALAVGDIEGWVFKDGNWLNCEKWKPIRTIDLIVTGFTDGTGENLGLIGSLICSTVEGHEVACAGGLKMKDRLEAEDKLGCVVEVSYQKVNTKGRLRHPRFKRWRDDKPRGLCTVDQDPMLKERIQ